MTVNIQTAKLIAKLAHKGQKYGDHDYFDYHVMGVFNIVDSLINYHKFARPNTFISPDVARVSALFHDIIEDTTVTMEDLNELVFLNPSFDDRFLPDIVNLLTDPDGETRKERKEKWLEKVLSSKTRAETDYVSQITIYQTFLLVKFADRLFNMRQGAKIDMYIKEHEKFKSLYFSDNDHINKMFPLIKLMEKEFDIE